MTEDVRRGRRIVLAYGFILVVTLAVLLSLSIVYGRPWHNVLKRALWPGAFSVLLWRGHRRAQWVHLALFAAISVSFMRYGLRRPASDVWAACWPLATLFASLGWMIGGSRCVGEFLAWRRRMLATPQPLRADAPTQPADACSCGRAVPGFVVLCPWCGVRRKELVGVDA